MKFNVHIKNIGKLTDAKLEFGQFTVLAGPNNTGKSFVSKLMYSIFDAMNANHVMEYIGHLMTKVGEYGPRGMAHLLKENSEFAELNSIIANLESIEKLSQGFAGNDSEKFDEMIGEIRKIIANMLSSVESVQQRQQAPDYKPASDELVRSLIDERYLQMLHKILVEFQENVEGAEMLKFITNGIEYKINKNLIQNFQIPSISSLRGQEESESKVDVANFGNFVFGDDGFDFNVMHTGLQELQEYSRVLYLESPVYWHLKNALDTARRFAGRSRVRRERLTGVPGYFYDLADALDAKYVGEMAFPDIHEQLTGKVIGGKISISDDGDLWFVENGRNFSLSVTALGVANLGVLALLIERKVLDEGTILFIDEPEAHLHPAWQVEMAETLFNLAERGVNIVIATHSADILKNIEVEAKKNPARKKMIALNHFSRDGVLDGGEQDFDARLTRMQEELAEPFVKLYLEGNET